ncbi:MAG: hypothetical protein AB7V48_08420 [Sedimentibacter sp.]
MNRNFYRSPGNGKPPIGFIVGIIFALLGTVGAVPQLIPLILITAIIIIVFTKRGKVDNRSADKFVNKSSEEGNNAGKLIDIKDIIVTNDESNTEGYKYKTDSQKRLEELENLYINGFMEKDEYEEKRKKLTGSN